MTRTEYINKFKNIVIEATRGMGLFPSVLMAQAILESSDKNGAAGEGFLAKYYNNHFGVKADSSWQGKKVKVMTREVISGKEVTLPDFFRVYEKAEQSFKDRNQFLVSNSRYKKAGVFDAPTPEAQAEALQRAGYATDPNYAAKVKGLIQSLNLKALDEAAKKNDSSEPV